MTGWQLIDTGPHNGVALAMQQCLCVLVAVGPPAAGQHCWHRQGHTATCWDCKQCVSAYRGSF